MKIVEAADGAVRVLRLEGRLDATSSPEVERHLAGLIAGGDRRLAVDCAGLEYVSSAGLRVFLSVAKSMKAAQGRLVLGALRPQVQEIFEIAGFTSVLEILGTLEDAVAACGR